MLKTRVKKLYEKQEPQQPIIVLIEDEEPTEAQRLTMARAKDAGIEPLIINVIAASKKKGAK